MTAIDDRPPWIDALRSPQRYAHAVTEVEVRETHLSWVLLAGEHAYKIKKPLRLDFVDFSTLERRREACLEEVRLNRRFSRGLYLGVVAITGGPEAPVMGGEGEPFEYAVQLRRFERRDELTELIARGEAMPDDLEELGRRVADVHESSARCDREDCLERTFATILGNARELERLASRADLDVGGFLRWTQAERPRLADAVERRCAAGRVRECHGDLHAGNIVKLDGALIAFDCIEFNAGLRCIDVANDAAFLFADLIAREARSLGYAFLNGWLERSGDYDAVRLLRYFSVYRALVRAKVALLGQDGSQAKAYLRAALALPRGHARLLIMCGLSGSGKTWLSRRILSEAGAIRLRSDVERKRLAGLRPEESSGSAHNQGIYTPEVDERVYALLRVHARSLLAAGEIVVVDAAFLKSNERLAFAAIAREAKIPFSILYCRAPERELRRRLEERQRAQRDASEADAPVMERQLGYWQPFTAEEHGAVIEVRTDEPACVEAALQALRETRPAPAP